MAPPPPRPKVARLKRPTVLLFDIDGTLVHLGGVGRRAFESAFERLHGRRDACRKLRFDGNTDRSAARFGLEAIGLSASEAAIDALLETYLAELDAEVARADRATFRIYAGVEATLQAVAATSAAVGLGTGNVERAARIKLEQLNLYGYFGFGGFGCDHEQRVEIIRRGAERGAARLGKPLSECRVVVIGDTPRDIDAARGIGAEAIGVGTGAFSAEQLRAHGAPHAFADLTAPGALQAILSE
ncbi:MAG TPA: HAD family hydrolase [Polyangiaceae bacterium]|nr:HAD family hydrolase [Polyangiaceae bacterium]